MCRFPVERRIKFNTFAAASSSMRNNFIQKLRSERALTMFFIHDEFIDVTKVCRLP